MERLRQWARESMGELSGSGEILCEFGSGDAVDMCIGEDERPPRRGHGRGRAFDDAGVAASLYDDGARDGRGGKRRSTVERE